MKSIRRPAAVGALMTTAAAAATLAGAPAAAAAEGGDPERIRIEGEWRSIAPGETQYVDEVRCPGSHPYVFNELYGGRPWLLTPGVEVLVDGGRSGELAVDIRSVLTRLEDATVTGIGPAERNRITWDRAGESATYRVDVHCTSDEQDSYA
ncbi:hypothetical protein [Agromyces aerolatus]|uniref:hypothetical protein n=1 Tax=Agromyces sp. LY-1074 TaxID=3074080 RepID=UPI002854F246|nr:MULTISPECIES: hypothetical protein [unclassified Agromyces]MDR5700270.1 hypothetical protein [Agromyces sp. LY-1074]MDR5706752.1 hypothetical protein [Agromyces sp. LY-1358]